MSKKSFIAATPVVVDGIATVNSQYGEDVFNYDKISLVKQRGYMIVVQKAHMVKVLYDGKEFESKRVFAAEVMKNDNGEIISTGSFTYLRINAIRQTHFGEVKEGEAAPIIMTTMGEDGRIHIDGATYFRAVSGNHGLGCRDKIPFVKYPNILWYTGDLEVWVPDFKDQALQADKNGQLVLTTKTINTFTAEPADGEVSKIKLGDLIDLKDPRYAELAAEE